MLPNSHSSRREAERKEDPLLIGSTRRRKIVIKNTRPFIHYLFNAEASSKSRKYLAGLCFYDFCQYCGAQRIEIYIDHIIPHWMLGFDWSFDLEAINYYIFRMDMVVLHELCHWAGANEKECTHFEGDLFDSICSRTPQFNRALRLEE